MSPCATKVISHTVVALCSEQQAYGNKRLYSVLSSSEDEESEGNKNNKNKTANGNYRIRIHVPDEGAKEIL